MSKYKKYICSTLEKRHLLPGPTPDERKALAAEGWRIRLESVLWIDSDVLPGSYYGESAWIWPPSYPNQITETKLRKRTSNGGPPMFPHVHQFPELLSWWGSDPDNPEDTTSMSMIMGDEELQLDNSWVAYIPAGMYHMPGRVPGGKQTHLPVYHWTFGPGTYTRDPDEAPGSPGVDADIPIPGSPKSNTQENLKYFVLGGQQKDIKRPDFMRELDPRYAKDLAYIDETVIPEAELGCDTRCLLPGDAAESGMVIFDPHTVPYGTSITLVSMNYDDITDLCAEAELWIGGEKHVIRKNFGAYIPPGIEQGPFIVRNLSKKLFLMMSFPVGEGIKKYPGGC
jgi:hypothetical protein